MDLQDIIQAEMAERQTEVVSVIVVTESEPTAKLVGPMVAAQQYPHLSLGEAVHVEWVGIVDGYTLPGFEVLVKVLPSFETHTPLSAAIRAEDRPSS